MAVGGTYNAGEGIRMALEVGAGPAGEWERFHAEPVDPRSPREEAVVMVYPYALLVDGEGRRFVDEGVGPLFLGRGSRERPRGLNRNFQSLFCIKRTIPSYASSQGFTFD